MTELILLYGESCQVDDEDFELLNNYQWYAVKAQYGDTVYAYRWDNAAGTTVAMHRQVLGFPELDVDHRDGDGLNNQKANLRPATKAQNQWNRKVVTGKSQYRGVWWDKANNKWRAGIEVNKKRIALGRFRNEEDAARAYDLAATTHYGEFASLNFPALYKAA